MDNYYGLKTSFTVIKEYCNVDIAINALHVKTRYYVK